MKRVRPPVWLALYGAMVLTTIPPFFISFPIPEFSAKFMALFSTVFLFGGCWSLGRTTSALMGKYTGSFLIEYSNYLKSTVFIFIGLGIVSTLTLCCGWIIPGPLHLKLFGISILLFVCTFAQLKSGALRFIQIPDIKLSWFEMGAMAVSIAACFCVFITCFSPITYYDSLVYHLALPAIYNQSGGIFPVPSNLYSYFPANMEMVFLFILNQFPQPEYVINLTGWMISILIGVVAADWAYEVGGVKAAVVAFFLWWTMPAVLLLSVGAYVDVALAAYILIALRLAIKREGRGLPSGRIFLSGLFAGLAISTKYTGATAAILIGTVLLFLLFLKRR